MRRSRPLNDVVKRPELFDVYAQIVYRLRDAVDRQRHGHARIVSSGRSRIAGTSSACNTATATTNRGCNHRESEQGNNCAPATLLACCEQNDAEAQ
jgi:hypothetical protein